MAGKSDYAENLVLDLLTGKSPSATRYVGLFTAAPTDAGGGTEVSGNNYSRKSTAAADWEAASGGATQNANAITFVTPSGSWGSCAHFGIFDAATSGNLLYWGPIGTPKTPSTGDTASFAAGALDLTED